MKIVFVSIYLNLHQLPFCLEMKKLLGENFTYISTSPITQDRLDMGFENMDEVYDFVLKSYDSSKEVAKARKLLLDADIAIMGSCPEKMLYARLNTNKLTFKYSERYFKGDNKFIDRLRYIYYSQRYIRPLQRKNVFFLCASAYTSSDVNKYCDFSGRTFKWGYFRENVIYDTQQVLGAKEKSSIIWVGRLIDWKHPEMALEIAEKLKEENISAHLKVIGDGPMKKELAQRIEKNGLSSIVTLIGSLPPEEVRKEMELSQIALLTSDYKEGWGMVVNEAMNACCAVVASNAMGAVPFLIRDGENGFTYPYDDIESAYLKIRQLLDDSQLSKKLGYNAYKTMIEEWDVSIAVERLLILAEKLLSEEKYHCEFENGPCSIADAKFN